MSERELWRAIKELRNELDQLRAVSRITYAKSTYTPTYLGASTAGTTTYTVQVGYYVRIGIFIIASGRVTWTNATGTGIALISLPFTSNSTTNLRYAVAVRTENVTFANTGIVGRLDPGNSQFQMNSPLTNAATAAVNVEAAGDVIFTALYLV